MTKAIDKSSQVATIADVENIVEKIVGKAVADLSDAISSFADDVSQKFEEVDARLDAMDAKYDRLLNTIDGFIARIDSYETENVARDAQMARLERWIEQIAAKTGIKLEY